MKLVEKAKANGADAILFTELKKERTGSSSFGGYGRSSSIQHYTLMIRGTFLTYTDTPPAPERPNFSRPTSTAAATPLIPIPAPRPTSVDDDLDSPVGM